MADNSKSSSSSNAPTGGSGASTTASSSSKLNATAAEFVPKSVVAAAPLQQQQVNMQMEMMYMQQNNPMMMNNFYGYAVPNAYGYYPAYADPYNMQPNQYPRSNNQRQNKHQSNNNSYSNNNNNNSNNNNSVSNDRNQVQNNNATANGGSTATKAEEAGNNASASTSSNSIGGYKDALQKGNVVAAPATEKGKSTTSSAEAVKASTPPATTASSTTSASTAGDTSVNTVKEDSNAKKNVTIDPTVTNAAAAATTTEPENKWRRTTLSVESASAGGNSTPSTPANSWNRGERLAVTATTLLERNDGVIRYDKMALLSLYTKGKECPPEIRKDYPQHSLEERAPCVAKNLKIPYNPHKKKTDDEPHPDEMVIFSQENLTKEAAFHYDEKRLNGDVNDPEVIIRKANLILNKLSVTKFDKLSDEFMAVGLDTPELMQRAVEIIVSKAQMEEHFCFMYADLCRKITDKWAVKESAEGAVNTTEDAITDKLGKAFRSRLLGRCEEEFNVDRVKELELIRNNAELNAEMKEEQEIITKKRYIGHMRFIGEIYMKDLIKKVTIESCIDELKESTDEDTLVCLVKLIQTIGTHSLMLTHSLTHAYSLTHSGAKFEAKSSGKLKMAEYFKTIETMSQNTDMSLRIRFMMKDLIDMRNNGWQLRRETEKAKTLDEIRAESEKNTSGKGVHKVKSGDNLSGRSGGTPKGGGSQDARSGWSSNSSSATDEWSTVTKSKAGKSAISAASPKASKPSSSVKFSNNTVTNVPNAKEKGKFGKDKKDSNKDKKVSDGSSAATVTSAADSTSSVPLRRERGPSLAGYDLEISVGKETIASIKACLEEYLANRIVNDFIVDLREIIHPNSYHEVVRTVILLTFDKKERDRETLVQTLLYELITNHRLFTSDQVRRGVQFILNDIDDILIDSPNALIYLCETLGYLIVHEIVPLLVLNHTSKYYDDSDMYIRCCKKDAIIVNTLSNIYKIKSSINPADSQNENVEMNQYVVDLYNSSRISLKDVMNYNEKRQSVEDAIKELGAKYGLNEVIITRLQT